MREKKGFEELWKSESTELFASEGAKPLPFRQAHVFDATVDGALEHMNDVVLAGRVALHVDPAQPRDVADLPADLLIDLPLEGSRRRLAGLELSTEQGPMSRIRKTWLVVSEVKEDPFADPDQRERNLLAVRIVTPYVVR